MALPTKSVLVTGASTGIGASCVQRLDARGYSVFAGVRNPADGERLLAGTSGRVRWLLLDVTDAAQVAAAADEVGSALGDRGLDGLVNNAGIAVGGPLEYVSPEALRRQLEVNVIGLHAVTLAFLPRIRRARGRIVHIGSVAGRLASPLVGAYSASKHAIEALADALRLELAPEGIRVSVIEPGQVRTPIWDKGLAAFDAVTGRIPPDGLARYGQRLKVLEWVLRSARKRGAPPEAVADAVVAALEANRPRARYVVGADARIRLFLGRILPGRASDALALSVLRRLAQRVR